MQIHALVFFVVQVAVSAYAFTRGGAPERIVAAELTIAAVIDRALPFDPGRSFHGVEWGALAVDVGLLACLTPIVLWANRYWPMWIAAVQADTIAIHGVRGYDPLLRAPVYGLLAGKAAYLILVLLVLGTLRHRAREADAGEREAAWIRSS